MCEVGVGQYISGVQIARPYATTTGYTRFEIFKIVISICMLCGELEPAPRPQLEKHLDTAFVGLGYWS